MESILKSDVFFFITSVCVFATTAVLIMVLAEILRIVRNIRYITDRVREEVEGAASDLSAVRTVLRENLFGLKPFMDAMKRIADKIAVKKPRTRKPSEGN